MSVQFVEKVFFDKPGDFDKDKYEFKQNLRLSNKKDDTLFKTGTVRDGAPSKVSSLV